MKNQKVKVLVIGLDGATWNFIKPWAEKGDLPTFKKLMENGCYGILKSTIPPVTIPAWPSFYTGKNPGKYGVYGFTKQSSKNYATSTTLKDIKSKKLWNYLNFHGKKTIIINMPLAYPPEKIDGIMVSGFPTPESVNYAYPEEIQRELEKLEYRIDLTPKELSFLNEKDLVKSNIELTKKHKEVFIKLMKSYEWDFLFLLLRAPDNAQHRAYQLKDEMKKIYKEVDEAVNEIIQNAKNTMILFMSDHGFIEMKKMFYVNAWLNQMNLLEFKEKKVSAKKDKKNTLVDMMLSLGITRERILSIAEKTSLSKYMSKIRKIIPRKIQYALPQTNLEINWGKTKVYFTVSGGKAININLKGREPNGVVGSEEYEEIREFIIEKLKELRDPETGEKIVKEIYKREEIYSGPYVKDAPDILFLTKDGYETSEAKIKTEKFVGNWVGWAGVHHIDGIFLAYGPGIKKGYEVKEAHIYDLLPTILHIFGLPIPNDVDGKVLMEIFEEDSEFAKRKPKYVDPSYYEKGEGERERVKGKIRERIRELKVKGKI